MGVFSIDLDFHANTWDSVFLALSGLRHISFFEKGKNFNAHIQQNY